MVGLLLMVIPMTAQYRECALFYRSKLKSLISSSLPNALLRDLNTVCLASGTQRGRYRSASIVVTYDTAVVVEQVSQLELTCSIYKDWKVTNVSRSVANATTARRKDCWSCAANSNDPSFDSVTHCSRKCTNLICCAYLSLNVV